MILQFWREKSVLSFNGESDFVVFFGKYGLIVFAGKQFFWFWREYTDLQFWWKKHNFRVLLGIYDFAFWRKIQFFAENTFFSVYAGKYEIVVLGGGGEYNF